MRPTTKITILGTRLGVIVLAVYWILLFVGTHIPVIPANVPKVNDKVMHFTAFFGLAFFLCYVSKPGPRWKRFGRIAAVALLYAAVDEYTQRFVPRRQPDWMDFLANAAGIFSAIACYMLAQIIYQRVSEMRRRCRAY